METYLLRLTTAALVCGVVTAFFGKKGTFGGVIQLLAGLFLTLNILSPWIQLRLDGWTDLLQNFSVSADTLGQSGENAAREAMAKRITAETEAYILDKARALQVSLTVDVILDDSGIPAPCGVRISGQVSPYAKGVLSDFMEKELGIPRKEQLWT